MNNSIVANENMHANNPSQQAGNSIPLFFTVPSESLLNYFRGELKNNLLFYCSLKIISFFSNR